MSSKRVAEFSNRSPSPPPLRRKLESTTTNKAVASFFTPLSKKEPEKVTWRIVNHTLLVGRYKSELHAQNSKKERKRAKIAAFDFDSTLIKTSSGNVFGKDAADWRWWHPTVPGILKGLHSDGFLVVIISNQGGISLKSDPKTVKSDQRRLSQFKEKVTLVFNQLDFPMSLYAATARDQYRKPRAGIWKELVDDYDLDVDKGLDLQNSIFVGDAGGRSARNGVRADYASSDRDFASNVGIDFKTPEEFFLEEPTQPFVRTFEPQLYLPPFPSSTPVEHLSAQSPTGLIVAPGAPKKFDKTNEVEIILFCGGPGAGKSTFYWENLKLLGYERVNQDTLKSRDKCLKVASDYLSSGQPVAIDNTNADVETRGHWIKLAQKLEVPIRCVYFTAPIKLCEHNDTVRALNQGVFNPEKRTILPRLAFTGYAARFTEPKLNEGFQEIIPVDFQFTGDEEQRKVWSRYWI